MTVASGRQRFVLPRCELHEAVHVHGQVLVMGRRSEEPQALRVYRNVLCEFYSGGLKNEAFQPRTLNDSLAHGRHHLA